MKLGLLLTLLASLMACGPRRAPERPASSTETATQAPRSALGGAKQKRIFAQLNHSWLDAVDLEACGPFEGPLEVQVGTRSHRDAERHGGAAGLPAIDTIKLFGAHDPTFERCVAEAITAQVGKLRGRAPFVFHHVYESQQASRRRALRVSPETPLPPGLDRKRLLRALQTVTLDGCELGDDGMRVAVRILGPSGLVTRARLEASGAQTPGEACALRALAKHPLVLPFEAPHVDLRFSLGEARRPGPPGPPAWQWTAHSREALSPGEPRWTGQRTWRQTASVDRSEAPGAFPFEAVTPLMTGVLEFLPVAGCRAAYLELSGGMLSLRTVIDARGAVTDTQVVHDDLGVPEVTRCIRTAAAKQQVAPPVTGREASVVLHLFYSRVHTRTPESASLKEGMLSAKVIRRVVQKNVGPLRSCFEAPLADSSKAPEALALKFVIGASGEVRRVAHNGDSVPWKVAGYCAARAALGWRFPKPEGGGSVTATYHFGADAARARQEAEAAAAAAAGSEGAPDQLEVKGALSPERVTEALTQQGEDLEGCLKDTPAGETPDGQTPDGQPPVTVGFVIDASGRVRTASVARSTDAQRARDRCLVEAVRGLIFPPADAPGATVVRYPLRAKPGPAQEAPPREADVPQGPEVSRDAGPGPGASALGSPAPGRGSLPKQVIKEHIGAQIGSVRRCYAEARNLAPGLSARIVTKFIIGPSGEVQRAAVTKAKKGLASFPGCVARAVRRMTFPPPEDGGIVIVTYPFTFVVAD